MEIKKLIQILSFFIILISINCNLTVYAPQKLIKEFNGQPIKYSIANFGHVPYGRTLIGPLVQAEPATACEPLKPFSSENEAPFVLIDRGNCTFVTKVKYAQLIGAKGVIITDNFQEASENITMSDDGHSYSLKIPSIFIEKVDGDLLKKYLNQNDTTDSHVVLTLKFDTQKNLHVNYTFWITTSNRQSFKLIREFKKYNEQIRDKTTFTPHYAIWTCHSCRFNNFTDEAPENCISGGRYCCPDPDGYGPGNGRDVVQEDLRQLCIYKKYEDKWWNYMDKFDLKCVESSSLEDCSKDIQNQLDIDTGAIQKCVENSFEKTGQLNILKDDNSILRVEREAFQQKGVLFWPSVSINDMQYRGNLDSNDIFEAICSVYDNPPQQCYGILGLQQEKGVNVTVIIMVVIIILIIFFFFMIFVYKRMVKREMAKEMSGQVNQMVSQYIAFYETREKKQKEEHL